MTKHTKTKITFALIFVGMFVLNILSPSFRNSHLQSFIEGAWLGALVMFIWNK